MRKKLSTLSAKFFVLAIFIVVSTNAASAQDVEKHLYYLSSEVNLGNYIGFSADVNYLLDEKYTFKLGVVGNFRKPTNQPDDFSIGLFGVLSLGLLQPLENMGSVNAAVGKMYYLNPKKSIRVNAAVGIGYTEIRLIENWQKQMNPSYGQNYTFDQVTNSTVSLIINPKVEFPLGRVFGFTLSPTAIINKEASYYGVGVGYMLGRIRSK